jgi:hypothetical protein
MEKAFRSYKLYEGQGMQFEAHVQELASQAALATEQGTAALIVTPHGLISEDQDVQDDEEINKVWFDLFEHGARQIIFSPGINNTEIREMLHVIAGNEGENDDILTSLWRREMKHIQVFVARTLVKGVPVDEDQQMALQRRYGRWRTLLAPDAGTGDKTIRLNPDDLRVLSTRDDSFSWCATCIENTHTQPQQDEHIDWEDEATLPSFLHLLGQIDDETRDTVLVNLVGSYTRLGLSHDLNSLLTATATEPSLSDWSLERLLTAAGGISALIPLIEAGPSAFKESLSALVSEDAATLEKLINSIDTESIRDEIHNMVVSEENSPLAYHSERLTSPSEEEQLDSLNALWAMGKDEATYLAIEACRSQHPVVRMRLLELMRKNYQPAMRHQMERLFRDTDEGVRIESLRFIKESGERYFLREALELVKSLKFGKRSEEEQMEIIHVLAKHAKLPAINRYFCTFANASSLLMNEHMRRIQLESFRVIRRFPSEDGREVLKRAAGRWVGNKKARETAAEELARLKEDDHHTRMKDGQDEEGDQK